MLLTGTMIAAAAGYIINEIKNSKGLKQAKDELSTAIWEWVRPVFLEDDEKLVKDIESDPEKLRPVLEYHLKRKAEEDSGFDEKLAALMKEQGQKAGDIAITGDGNTVYQNVQGNIQHHSGSGDNVGGNKTTGK